MALSVTFFFNNGDNDKHVLEHFSFQKFKSRDESQEQRIIYLLVLFSKR